jgi:transcriptional regulator with XRE-family HTH domain
MDLDVIYRLEAKDLHLIPRQEITKMARKRQLPSNSELRLMRNQGWTQKEIAKESGVSESAVWKALQRAGYTQPVPTYKDILPAEWKLKDEHKATAIMEKFRSLVKQKKGVPLRQEEEERLVAWLRDLRDHNLVVAYHPDAPPNDASTKGGWYYVPRSEEDDWIIRRPSPS